MRKKFAEIIHKEMSVNKRIVVLTADLGYGLWDRIKIDYPDRFFDFGSSEQLMIGAACGMSRSGLYPIVYSITPFLLYRPFEFIRNYVDHEKIPMMLVGGGRDRDYGNLGFSHWAEDDLNILSNLPNIYCYRPVKNSDLNMIISNILLTKQINIPCYINLEK